jgi:hypothetical protein
MDRKPLSDSNAIALGDPWSMIAPALMRPTWLKENPSSSNAKAHLRRSASRSALPFCLGREIPRLNTHDCIIDTESTKPRIRKLLETQAQTAR